MLIHAIPKHAALLINKRFINDLEIESEKTYGSAPVSILAESREYPTNVEEEKKTPIQKNLNGEPLITKTKNIDLNNVYWQI